MMAAPLEYEIASNISDISSGCLTGMDMGKVIFQTILNFVLNDIL